MMYHETFYREPPAGHSFHLLSELSEHHLTAAFTTWDLIDLNIEPLSNQTDQITFV